ncbi:hypothetical protein QWZ13_11480 [Reinekea marina]|uniref:Extradiol dioxygenase n=1 Tax=Reinekea marina TaxID=1310421 RepID=A0ABV7WQJ3_9GAMM|nr:hypothetical protein [Reinekea marina]MDN3649536.1 hypothetical protein [Reinekea marina]
MISGAHSIIYSNDADADRNFFRDVLKFPHVDVGGGWLIFKLPPSELAFHPIQGSSKQEFYLTCDDIHSFIESMSENKIPCTDIQDESWGLLVHITLPGGSNLGVYQPLHASPHE